MRYFRAGKAWKGPTGKTSTLLFPNPRRKSKIKQWTNSNPIEPWPTRQAPIRGALITPINTRCSSGVANPAVKLREKKNRTIKKNNSYLIRHDEQLGYVVWIYIFFNFVGFFFFLEGNIFIVLAKRYEINYCFFGGCHNF